MGFVLVHVYMWILGREGVMEDVEIGVAMRVWEVYYYIVSVLFIGVAVVLVKETLAAICLKFRTNRVVENRGVSFSRLKKFELK